MPFLFLPQLKRMRSLLLLGGGSSLLAWGFLLFNGSLGWVVLGNWHSGSVGLQAVEHVGAISAGVTILMVSHVGSYVLLKKRETYRLCRHCTRA